ncbi:MAG: hypothetical protein IJQ34_05380 [Kiritimatiellae bacterium]|nr:hypothetical protein [Kiritimatiellia bacterium]
MKTPALALLAATTLVFAAFAKNDKPFSSGLRIKADRMAADNITGTVVASGNVSAVSHPVCLMSDLVSKKDDVYTFADPTSLTTCTNSADSLHWCVSGGLEYKDGRYVEMNNIVLKAFGIPVMWLPYWYYPLNTDYGWRVTPGYSGRWGGYLLTKYVYGLAGSFDEGEFGLAGSTRLDLRTKNGVAAGQGLKWQLGDFGRGKFKVYYAWDQDADKYDHNWNKPDKYHNENWGSKVEDERYALMLEHLWEASERDIVRLRGAYYSDSHFTSDFLRDAMFGSKNRYVGHTANEAAWEHNENPFAFGVSVSGPLNDFYTGVARLPEVYFDWQPAPVFSLPVTYESQTRFGFLNRNYAKHGDRYTGYPFRYAPGEWADYQTFRADTYHRLALPFKIADVLSVVPRAGFRATYWNDTGRENLTGVGRAGSMNSDTVRTIVEGGVTFSARATGDISEDWQHMFEPYFDILAQEAKYHGLKNGARPFVFDSVDASRDWLDQFAGRSRNLPYSWYGVTPGIRNAFKALDENGRARTVFDVDFYSAIQFNDTSWTEGNRYHKLAKNPSKPNYGKHAGTYIPGMRLRWFPDEDCALKSRIEYDSENETIAYADIAWRQKLSSHLNWELSFNSRDHRWWDYSSSPYDPALLKNEDFNMSKFSLAGIEFEHEICDAFAWGPFIRWDCRESELDEIGSWFDYRTDCLGFRFSVSYENDYRRVDWSKSDDDWRFGFFIYLRALGPDSGSMFR